MAPFICDIAWLALRGSAMDTNAKPRDRPLSRSVTMRTSVTSPNWLKASRNASSLVWKDRLPTYNRLLMSSLANTAHDVHVRVFRNQFIEDP